MGYTSNGLIMLRLFSPIKLIIILVLLATFLIAGGRVLEMQPGFCASCHEMEDAYANWQTSGASRSHDDCIGCHSGPGLWGVIEAEVRGFGQLMVHISAKPGELVPPFKAHLPNSFCVKCHPIPAITPIHNDFSFEGEMCSKCHKHSSTSEFAGEIP